jgi:hypothetical protein
VLDLDRDGLRDLLFLTNKRRELQSVLPQSRRHEVRGRDPAEWLRVRGVLGRSGCG